MLKNSRPNSDQVARARTPNASDEPRRVGLAVTAMTAVQTIVTVASLVVSIAAPEIARDLGISAEWIGIYASLTFIGAMLGALMAGGFVLRFGAVRFTQILTVICALGLLFCLGPHWLFLAASGLVCGLGYGPATPASSHVLTRHTPAHALSFVLSIKQTGVPLGGLLAGLVIPLLILHFGWRGSLYVVVAILIVTAIALQSCRSTFDIDPRADTPLIRGNVRAPLQLVLGRSALRRLALAAFFFSATQQSYIYYLVTYLETDLGWTNQHAGMALSALGAGAVIGRILWGIVADRLVGRSHSILAFLALCSAIASTVTAYFGTRWPLWAIFSICALFGATGAGWNGVYLAEISRRVGPQEVSYATGGGLSLAYLGVVIMPPVFALLLTVNGDYTLPYLSLAVAMYAVFALLLRASSTPP